MKKLSVLTGRMKSPALLFCGILIGCSGQQDPGSEAGKQIWQANCQVCHLNGIAGAPQFGKRSAWLERIAKGEAVLIEHALNGFEGSEGLMPARGGNTALKDEEVKAAVRYMVSQSQ